MRIAVLSDVHGNLTALEAVIADLRDAAPDLVLHGGDLADGGSSAAGVVTCEGSDAVELVAGRAVVVPMGLGPVVVESEAGASFVRCFEP